MTETCLPFANVPHVLDGRLLAPSFEPITPDECGDHARIDGPEESSLLLGYIAAAREWVENEIGVSLGQRTVTLYMDYFPSWAVEVRFPPLQSVTSIVYLDSSGTSTTLSSSLYRVDTTSRPGRIEPAYAQVWPVTYPVNKAITVTAVVGYTAASLVPNCAKQAVRYLAAMMYQNREPTDEDLRIVRRILDPLRWTGEV